MKNKHIGWLAVAIVGLGVIGWLAHRDIHNVRLVDFYFSRNDRHIGERHQC